MKILVTGANGFLGQHVVSALLARRHQVRVLVRPAADLDQTSWRNQVDVFRADLRSTSNLESAFNGIDVLVHLAAAVTGGGDAQFSAGGGGAARPFVAGKGAG